MNEERLNEQTDREDQGQDISAREARRQELIGMFNPNRLKVVRKELFPSPRDPALTIRDGNISFNAAGIKMSGGCGLYQSLTLMRNWAYFLFQDVMRMTSRHSAGASRKMANAKAAGCGARNSQIICITLWDGTRNAAIKCLVI